MSVPTSFINYMKTMRDYYKSGAPYADPLPADFNFDDMETDAHSYGFTCNNGANDINHHAMNTNTDSKNDSNRGINTDYHANSIRNEELTVDTTINSPAERQDSSDKSPLEAEEMMATEVKVIRLFDQGEILLSLDSTTQEQEQEQQKRPLTIIEKISAAFSKLFS